MNNQSENLKMKNIISVVAGVLFFLLTANSQQEKAEFLKEPSAWQFERFSLPPVFSSDFPYKGIEELRFSPGMFIKDSSDYFSYAFIAQLDSTAHITQSEIKNYLLPYFKGLCGSTAKQRNLSIDTSQINVSVEKKNNVAGNGAIYNSVLNVFGVFADGAPVTLNAEMKILNNTKSKKTYLVFIASPHNKKDGIWKQLYKIQNDFMLPLINN
jgi:hypothetical protein